MVVPALYFNLVVLYLHVQCRVCASELGARSSIFMTASPKPLALLSTYLITSSSTDSLRQPPAPHVSGGAVRCGQQQTTAGDLYTAALKQKLGPMPLPQCPLQVRVSTHTLLTLLIMHANTSSLVILFLRCLLRGRSGFPSRIGNIAGGTGLYSQAGGAVRPPPYEENQYKS